MKYRKVSLNIYLILYSKILIVICNLFIYFIYLLLHYKLNLSYSMGNIQDPYDLMYKSRRI